MQRAPQNSSWVELPQWAMGMHCPNLDQQEAGDLDPAASRATQAVMRAATAYPLSDAQLERIVKLALGKRVPVPPAVTAGGNPPPDDSSGGETRRRPSGRAGGGV
jgi:hypothetical protein